MKPQKLHISISGGDIWNMYSREASNKVLFAGIFMWLHTKESLKKEQEPSESPWASCTGELLRWQVLEGRREVGADAWGNITITIIGDNMQEAQERQVEMNRRG